MHKEAHDKTSGVKAKSRSGNQSVDRLSDNSARREGSTQSVNQQNRKRLRLLKQFDTLIDILVTKNRLAKRCKEELTRFQLYNYLLVQATTNLDRKTIFAVNRSKFAQEKKNLQAAKEYLNRLMLQIDENRTNLRESQDFYNNLYRELGVYFKNFQESTSNPVRPYLQKTRSAHKYDKMNNSNRKRLGSEDLDIREFDYQSRTNKSYDVLPDRDRSLGHRQSSFDDFHPSKHSNGSQALNILDAMKKDSIEKTIAQKEQETIPQNPNINGFTGTKLRTESKLDRFSKFVPLKARPSGIAIDLDQARLKNHSINMLSIMRTGTRMNSIMDNTKPVLRKSVSRNSRLEAGQDINEENLPRRVMTIKEFYHDKRMKEGKTRVSKISKKPKVVGNENDGNEFEMSLSDEVGTVTSSIGSSIVEEIQEELNERMQHSQETETMNRAFVPQKVKPNFIPVKIHFVIGIQDTSFNVPLTATKERIYKDFEIREIYWHLKDRIIVGVQLFLFHKKEKFYLEGKLHGIKGDEVESFIFKPHETFNKIDYISDEKQLMLIKLATNLGRHFKTGKDKKTLFREGHSFTSRYFPKEVKLCKFFSSYNPKTQRLVNIRFMYVRTVFY